MRSINLIIKELTTHPEYMGGRFWTKEDIALSITHNLQYEFDEQDILVDVEDITDNEWIECAEMIEEYYDAQEQSMGYPIDMSNLEDLRKRMIRDFKLSKTLDD